MKSCPGLLIFCFPYAMLLCSTSAVWAHCQASTMSCSKSHDRVVKRVVSNATCESPGILSFTIGDTYQVNTTFSPDDYARTATASVWVVVGTVRYPVRLGDPRLCESGMLQCPLKPRNTYSITPTFTVQSSVTIPAPLKATLVLQLMDTKAEIGDQEIFCIKFDIVIHPGPRLSFVVVL